MRVEEVAEVGRHVLRVARIPRQRLSVIHVGLPHELHDGPLHRVDHQRLKRLDGRQRICARALEEGRGEFCVVENVLLLLPRHIRPAAHPREPGSQGGEHPLEVRLECSRRSQGVDCRVFVVVH